MTGLGLLFVAEAALLRIEPGHRAGRVRVAEIRSDLVASYPSLFTDCEYAEVSRALRLLFPIHKNGRRRQRVLKVRPHEAYRVLGSRRIRLRPFADIEAKAENDTWRDSQ
jgi:hypothetical protein